MDINEASGKIRLWRERPDVFVRDVFNITPDPWQDKVLQAFPHQSHIALCAPLSYNNIIPTPSGMMRFGDIKVGDKVFTHNGTPTTVTQLHHAGIRPMYRVTFNDGSFVDASDNHTWTVVKQSGKRVDISTYDMFKQSIMVNGKFRYSVPTQGSASFDAVTLPLDPYVFGLWIGDGSRNEPSIICPDPNIRKAIEDRGFQTSIKANNKTVRILNNVQSFIDTGINDLYSFQKRIPDVYKYSSVEQRTLLLRGMMDSDGTCTLGNQSYLATSSIQLANDFMWLARSLGYWSKLSGPYKIGGGKYRDSYRVTISGDNCPFLAYTTKFKRWKKPSRGIKRRAITSIQSISDAECMCITVSDPSHLFLANDFIVSHNCKGPGKAQPKTLLIHTPQGLVPFGSLSVGSTVFAPDGSPTRVTQVFDRGVLPMYRILFDDGSHTLCCGEHMWRVSSDNGNTFVDVDTNYMLSHPATYSLPHTLPVHFQTQSPTSITPHEFGASVNGLDYLRGVSELRSVPVTQRYIPRSYKYSSPRNRFNLLLGIIDANSSPSSSALSFCSPELAQDVAFLFRSLGCWASIVRNRHVIYYPNRRRTIVSITPSAPRDAMCIQVAHHTSCYLCNDFIVTHNTALLSWLAWNFLITRTNPKIGALSITEKNLRDGLWSEMTKWQSRSQLLTESFSSNTERIYINDPQHKANWYMSARTWSKGADDKTLGETLQGFHEDNIMILLDESSGIPDAILAAAEAILSSCKDGHIVQAGNPMELKGPLYRAAVKDRSKWWVMEITGDPDDPNRASRVSIEWARGMIRDYGRDNPWVLSSVFGRFPPTSINSLIGDQEVQESVSRFYREDIYDKSPRILGIDVARDGDDSSVITKRQGLVIHPQIQHRNINGTEGADIVARLHHDWCVDAMFLDGTGGYGSSWYDNLVRLNYNPVDIKFNGRASNPTRFANKRTEMMWDFVEWIKRGGKIPDQPELIAALTNTTYSYTGDRIIIEPKDSIKAKLTYSPDHMDSAILTFAQPVSGIHMPIHVPINRNPTPYDPLSTSYLSNQMRNYDPFKL